MKDNIPNLTDEEIEQEKDELHEFMLSHLEREASHEEINNKAKTYGN